MSPYKKRQLLYSTSPELAIAWYKLALDKYRLRYREEAGGRDAVTDAALWAACETGEVEHREVGQGFLFEDGPSEVRGYLQHSLIHQLLDGSAVAFGPNNRTEWIKRIDLRRGDHLTVDWKLSRLRVNFEPHEPVRVAHLRAVKEAGLGGVRSGPRVGYGGLIAYEIKVAEVEGEILEPSDELAEWIARRVRLRHGIEQDAKGLSPSKIKEMLRNYIAYAWCA